MLQLCFDLQTITLPREQKRKQIRKQTNSKQHFCTQPLREFAVLRAYVTKQVIFYKRVGFNLSSAWPVFPRYRKTETQTRNRNRSSTTWRHFVYEWALIYIFIISIIRKSITDTFENTTREQSPRNSKPTLTVFTLFSMSLLSNWICL